MPASRRSLALGLVAASLAVGVAAGGAGAIDSWADARDAAARPPLVSPSWERQRRVTVLVDSVLLGGMPALRDAMPRRRFAMRGRPALMVGVAERELRDSGRRVAPLVIVGLGYNSLWERDRRRFGYWARRFDAEAERLLRTLRRRGARQIFWVTLREPTAGTVPPAGLGDLGRYAWYFPYVNGRLRALAARHDDVVLADWRAASDRPGLTYDAIHLDPDGARLMARTIRATVNAEARRQGTVRTIRTDGERVTAVGGFRPAAGATLADAIRAFGPPSRRARIGGGCRVSWRLFGLRIVFGRGGRGGRGGLCVRGVAGPRRATVSGRLWRTGTGLRGGHRVRRLRDLYPGAVRKGSELVLVERLRPECEPGAGCGAPLLTARLERGRVIGFDATLGGR